ncbi:hypothetical protein S40285_09537 [Stachybotrys chlorohalonatus IBT 40285]|uniref:Ketoreductase domain-containing protein n=1 Tax=Stachybotrys chlorohalonatus (strain IBT 40285) TaxID=1283841 RepID=A0A084QZ96_STAC4|nr:hypothetical protein S40285_09537 [Stachybotrys chlorohalonata IBT 40285]
MAQPKVYLITGCSSGVGYHLCKAALAAGHKVIATARNLNKSPAVVSELESLGAHWCRMDVTSADLRAQIEMAIAVYRRVDVLINNAGIAIGGPVEHTELSLARAVFETNFFGVMRIVQDIIPIMRSQGSGTIVNISSGSTLRSLPTIGIYAASKCAIEGFTESLKAEVAAFGIRVLLAHPGDMRTGFIQNSTMTTLNEAYKGTMAETVLNVLTGMAGKGPIDPVRAGQLIVNAIDGTGLMARYLENDYMRLPLGSEILRGYQQRVDSLTESLNDFSTVAKSVEFE